ARAARPAALHRALGHDAREALSRGDARRQLVERERDRRDRPGAALAELTAVVGAPAAHGAVLQQRAAVIGAEGEPLDRAQVLHRDGRAPRDVLAAVAELAGPIVAPAARRVIGEERAREPLAGRELEDAGRAAAARARRSAGASHPAG